MSVLLPNTWLAVRKQGDLVEDSHGDKVPGGWTPVSAHYEGRVMGEGANLQGGEDARRLGLDPALWPVKPKDIVVETDEGGTPTGREWFVRTADLLKHSNDSTVDWVRVIGQVRVGSSTSP